MAHQLFRQPSFAAGELSSTLYGRTDIPRYATGVKRARNFITTRQGPAINRPGFVFLGEAYDPTHAVRLETFTFSNSQTYVLEFGHNYIRSWQNGALVGNRVTSTYTSTEIFRLKLAQMGDVVTITHPAHAVAELKRTVVNGNLTWVLANVDFSRAAFPAGITLEFAGTGASGEKEGPWDRPYDVAYPYKKWEWAVTAVSITTGKETLPSNILVANWNPAGGFQGAIRLYPDNPVRIRLSVPQTSDWQDVEYFNIYRGRNKMFGYVGRANLVRVRGGFYWWTRPTTTDFLDTALSPVLNVVPPTGKTPFTDDNPAVNCFFQGRRVMANLLSDSTKLWFSKISDYTGFDPPDYPGADDGLYLSLASRYLEEVRWLIPLRTLLVGTSQGIWTIGGAGNSALTSGSIDAQLQLSNGASWLDPLIVNNALLYTMDKSGYVLEILYRQDSDGYQSASLSLWAEHLFDGYTISDWCYQQVPDGVVWMVRSDGKLLGLTYMREQEVWGWHWHDTEGTFESVCSVTENGRDRVYAVVNRNGSRYIERLDDREHSAVKDFVFLDSAKSYSFQNDTSTLTGLSHLEGMTVYALVDGVVQGPFVVSSGSIELTYGGKTICVGLPYVSELELLELHAGGIEVRGINKTVVRAMFEVTEASVFEAGEDFSHMNVWTSRGEGTAYDAPEPTAELAEVYIRASWNKHGRACLRQSKPFPVTVVGAIREVAFGG